MLKSSLHDTRNLVLIVVSSMTLISGSSFLAMYGTYLGFVLFPVEVSLLLLERSQLFSLCLGCFDREPPFFLSTVSSASIWVVTRWCTSDNVSIGFLISESVNELANIPCSKASDHHLLILCLKSYRDCTKSIQVCLERLPFTLFNI